MSGQGFDSIDIMARVLCSDLDFSDVNDNEVKEIVKDLQSFMDLLDVTEETIPLDKVEGKLAEASETLGVNPSVFANITYSSNPVRVAEVQSKVLEILSSR